MFLFLALLALLFGAQAEQRGEGLTLAGLPLGSFSGDGLLRHTDEEVRLELRTSQEQRTVTLSFWPATVPVKGTWQARGASRFAPDGATQRLELRQAEIRLVFLDNVKRGADLVEGWRLERLEPDVQLSLDGREKGLELDTPISLSENWCATLLGVSLPHPPPQGVAGEVTEASADLLIATCNAEVD